MSKIFDSSIQFILFTLLKKYKLSLIVRVIFSPNQHSSPYLNIVLNDICTLTNITHTTIEIILLQNNRLQHLSISYDDIIMIYICKWSLIFNVAYLKYILYYHPINQIKNLQYILQG